MPLVNISLPRLLPDLDGDGMSEMIAACAVTFPSEVARQFKKKSEKQMTLPNTAEDYYYVNYVNVNSVKNSTVDCKYLLYFQMCFLNDQLY